MSKKKKSVSSTGKKSANNTNKKSANSVANSAKSTKRIKISKSTRDKLYKKYDGHCAYCGSIIKRDQMTVDHIKPLADGGANSIGNYNPCCTTCNRYKADMSIRNFRKYLVDIHEKLLRDDNAYNMALAYGMVVPQQRDIEFYYETHKAYAVSVQPKSSTVEIVEIKKGIFSKIKELFART